MKPFHFPSFPWEALLSWYEENGRHDLPWRDYNHDSSTLLYRVWLSEIFLQQTQVSRVIGYFERVLERYPTVASLATSDYETFFPYYQGLGYYSRARNILKTAAIIHTVYNDIFPKEKSLLQKLPGVGSYTAHALLAFGYGEPYLAWDTNLEKVFARYYHGRKDEKLTDEEKTMIEEDFRRCINSSSLSHRGTSLPRAINNALMDFAALIDRKDPLMIDWEGYPIRSGLFYETRGSLEPKMIKRTVSFPLPDAQIIVVLHRDHQIYYSLGVDYRPFLLPPAVSTDIRGHIQEVFRTRYGLELSVRPPKKKWISDAGVPYILVTAQIQLGDISGFQIHEKRSIRPTLDELSCGILPPGLAG